MKRIGEVKTITGSIAIVQSEDQTRPKIGTKVIDEKLENVGRIVDVIGPVSRPYMVVKIKENVKIILKKRLYSR
ncbi:MAG: H/ACA RNA-protein complex protein Gar1 [Halobacteriales archaeon]|nr:H/ACA RNA-protein complex protein Gar1 [Halobacteriales archaeon]|tara:strand:- start:263 stop:484 length:222 start_codon:yes stop_codon:yes gene_type:complete